ncbi:N-6 DNA methylase [Micromonospora sp. NPDC005707]|uniref:N-6 DNA methylase n=1 Tax=Micromonospora sp. NPDC005707 TaxID=3157050 RepID=UPI0033E0F8CD
MPPTAAAQAIARLASRDATRTEADLQADIYVVLTSGGLSLADHQVARLEVQTGDGTRRRLDVEIGHAVIEVKRDLRVGGVLRDAELQLAGYVSTQSARLGTRYVGILTDGTQWRLYHLVNGTLECVAELELNTSNPDVERLLVWLEAILATQDRVLPTPEEIRRRIGASSPSHLLDHATLTSLYAQAAEVPEVQLKRQLWSKLLRTAFGKSFTDDATLFVNHTLLVLTAEIIAHAVVGFDVSRTGNLNPSALAQGTSFASAKVHGAVEADFFDWVLHIPEGPDFITDLAHRIGRFDWSQVEHDVLKVLYESVISQDERRSLGEYYTPDWLAERIVANTIRDPLSQRVLDPSCGSGTFLFHAIRAYLSAADDAGIPSGKAVTALTEHVFGMDIHPVSVTLARVTYLLAIGNDRLQAPDRGPISIPVYLGDSLQWEQRRDLFGGRDEIRIATSGDDLVAGGGMLFGDDLVFPRSVSHDAGDFDRLVDAMANRAVTPSAKQSKELILPTLRQFGVHEADISTLVQTFDTMRRLHDSGRDHIWGYYVRNLIRPLWLAEPAHRVDVLVGNPPWLRYSSMTDSMQDRYKALARDRGLLSGPLGASGRDLSTLFVARAVQLYLKDSGRFSFVMPHGVLTRKPADGFRSGRWGADVNVAFTESWDLQHAPTGFPMVSCVVHGHVTAGKPKTMPADVTVWSARLRSPNVSWDQAKARFQIEPGRVQPLSSTNLPAASPYKSRFRQGAVLAPRVLLFVEEAPAGPLGAGAGRLPVRSRRTTIEKPPWKELPSLTGVVEQAFVRSVHLGETLLPFRPTTPLRAVLPITDRSIMTPSQIDNHPDLNSWWEKAEQQWSANKPESDSGSLLDRINYHNQLSAQLPAARHRVIYTASGNTLAAARIDRADISIEHVLYWAAASSIEEARFLTAILNSGVVLERIRPLQTLGLFGPRHFDKHVFDAPIPVFDAGNSEHMKLVSLAADAEEVAAGVDVTGTRDFKQARKLVRNALASSGITDLIETAVATVVPPVAIPEV